MPNVLKIQDCTDNFLDFDLRDMVALVPSEGERLAWCVFPMGERTEITWEAGQELASRVNASDSAVPLAWRDLVLLAGSIVQTIWGTFIGCQEAGTLGSGSSLFLDDWHYLDRATHTFYATVEIAFQAVDSSFWLVYAKDKTIEERITAAFRDVTVLQVG